VGAAFALQLNIRCPPHLESNRLTTPQKRIAKPWQRVFASLGLQSAGRRLLCFLDDEDWRAFKAQNGAANRGFYAPVRAVHPHWLIAPRYLLETVFVDGAPAFDDFVYFHGTTCAGDIALTMTLAHELQHFIQHADRTSLWAANSLVPNLDKTAIAALGLRWCDIFRFRAFDTFSAPPGGTLDLPIRFFDGSGPESSERVTDRAEGQIVDWLVAFPPARGLLLENSGLPQALSCRPA